MMNIEIQRMINIVIVAVIFFIFFRIVSKISERIGRKRMQRLGSVLRFFEPIVYFVLIIRGIYVVFQLQTTQAIGVAVLLSVGIVAALWSTIKDIAAGIIIRLEKKLNAGDEVQVNKIEGTIQKLGSRSLELTDKSGKVFIIPYRFIVEEMQVKTKRSPGIYPVYVQIPLPEHIPTEHLMEKIERLVFTSIWSSLNIFPEAKLTEKEGRYNIEIIAYAFDPELQEELYNDIKMNLLKNMEKSPIGFS